jgi:hypothetical protein
MRVSYIKEIKVIKKFVGSACLCCFLLTGALAAFAESPALPEIPGWQNGECRVTGLETVSGVHGFWAERSYRAPNGGAFKATLMTGKGPAFLYPPASGLSDGDGLLGEGATYETFQIGGNEAILESHPVLGLSLSLRLQNGVLTLESGAYGMEKKQIVDAAETLAALIEQN